MATLQTCISRRVAGREYVKSELVIPRELVQRLSWSDDQTIDFKVIGQDKLLLIPAQREPQLTEPNFENFAAAVTRALSPCAQGLTWSQIRQQSGLRQKTPNPVWVYKLEMEHNLRRIIDKKTSQTLWRLGPNDG